MEVLDNFLPNRPAQEELEEKGVLPRQILKTLSFWKRGKNSESSGDSKRGSSPTTIVYESTNRGSNPETKGKPIFTEFSPIITSSSDNSIGKKSEGNNKQKNAEHKESDESQDSPDEKANDLSKGKGSRSGENQDSGPKKEKDDKKKRFAFQKKKPVKKDDKKGKGKRSDDKENREEEEVDDSRSPVVANCVEELPEELQKKIRKSKIEDEKLNANFDILCNVLRFTAKRNIIRPNTEGEEKKKKLEKGSAGESNLPPQMLKAAEEFIHHVNPKKLYKKTEFAGKGGFGRVYYAKSVKDRSTVAIKKMPHITAKEKRMNIDEIAVLNMCNHPNIVMYFKSYIYENEVAVIMEYMEGGSLSEAVKRYSFEEPQIAYVGREMLQGIAYLHKNNLVHRDLKSANVMMSTKGHVKLIDFGLTVDISRCRLHMVGSPFWMPPEMIKCEPHGFKADIWSFAVCLIEMADKKPPNRKARIKAMFVTATEGLIPYVDEQTKYSPIFKDFLRLCLQIDPEKRSSPDELLNHAFIVGAAAQRSMQAVLKEVFLTNAFESSGLFL